MATTLGLCILGIAGAAWLGARRGAAVAGLGVLFAGLALRQGTLLYGGDIPDWGPGATALAEIALGLVALGGLGALRAIHRTTRERDRVEDLHWDSMEAVRVMSDLAARPGGGLPEKLTSVLELGRRRFGLDAGLAWRIAPQEEDGEAGGELLAMHAPAFDAARREALTRDLAPRLEDLARTPRPTFVQGLSGEAGTLFAAGVASGGEVHGVLAFAGIAPARQPFTATDKDLLGLMAWWLATELEHSARPAAAPAPEAVAAPHEEPGAEAAAAEPAAPAARLAQVAREAFRPRRGLDLNRDVRRVEARLRRRIGADATLSLQLAKGTLPLRRGQISPPRLVESLVEAAVRLCPTGRLTLATEPPAEGGSETVLRVAVAGPVERTALERAFAEPADGEAVPHGTLPLPRLERLLHADGGDLSISIEPGVQAVLTAWLPSRGALETKPSRRALGVAAPAPGPASPAQSSR